MRAAVLTSREDLALQLEDVPDPTPEPGDVILRVEACGVCGSDLHLATALRDYLHAMPSVVFGHEFAGEVVALGSDVTGYEVGDRVVGFPLAGCRSCAACLRGDVSKCASATLTGVQRHGGYAEYVAVGAAESFVLPEPVPYDLGALVEPLAVAHHALERTPREPGEPVLVLGAGPVGAAVALWAQVLGASDVVVSDPVESRRKLSESLGASVIDPTTEDVAEAFAQITGQPPKVVVECVGIPGLVQHATEVAAVDGHVTVLGACTKPDTFNPLVPTAKELTLQYVLYYRRRDFAQTLAHLANGRLDASSLVTDRVSLTDLPARFQALMQPTTECKVLVHPHVG